MLREMTAGRRAVRDLDQLSSAMSSDYHSDDEDSSEISKGSIRRRL